MNIGSAIAIYFLIWWLVLFAVLPFGVRNAHESGEAVAEGHDAGAPVAPLLLKKVIATTVIAALVFALGTVVISSGWFSLDSLPFLGTGPKQF